MMYKVVIRFQLTGTISETRFYETEAQFNRFGKRIPKWNGYEYRAFKLIKVAPDVWEEITDAILSNS